MSASWHEVVAELRRQLNANPPYFYSPPFDFTPKEKPTVTVTDTARVTTIKPAGKKDAPTTSVAEKRARAESFRTAAQHLGKIDPGKDSEKGRAARALREAAAQLDKEAKVDEFAQKASPFDMLLSAADGLNPRRVYGPDAEGRFWRVESAALSHRPLSGFAYRRPELLDVNYGKERADIRLIRVEPS